MIGGGGADFVDGGQGSDLLELDGSAGVTAEGGDGTDTVVLVGETNEASLSGVEVVVGSAGDDSVTVSTNDIASVSGGSGIDDVTLTDASGNTVDLAGVEVIAGSAGDDILTVTDDTSVTVDGGDGSDTLTGNVGDDTLLGGGGSDVIDGGDGADTLFGGSGSDTLVGGGGADVAVFTGPKGSHTFGIDEPSGLLTVTSKETGSVDTIDSIETLAFDDGFLSVSKSPDRHFSTLEIPTDAEVSGFTGGAELEVSISGGGLSAPVSFSFTAGGFTTAQISLSRFRARSRARSPGSNLIASCLSRLPRTQRPRAVSRLCCVLPRLRSRRISILRVRSSGSRAVRVSRPWRCRLRFPRVIRSS